MNGIIILSYYLFYKGRYNLRITPPHLLIILKITLLSPKPFERPKLYLLKCRIKVSTNHHWGYGEAEKKQAVSQTNDSRPE